MKIYGKFKLFLSMAAGLILWSGSLFCYAAGPGTSSATFLKLGFGARPLAMGETYVALADDVSMLHYNPAGLAMGTAERKGYQLLVSHALHIQDISLSQIGLLHKGFGLSLTYLSVGGIEARTSDTAVPESMFSASDFAFGASYGRMISGLGVGISGRIVRQSIRNQSAGAFSADAGVLYRFSGWPVSAGASLCNAGTKIKFDEEGYPLPFVIRAGAAVHLQGGVPAVIGLQADFPRDSSVIFRAGLEYLGFGPFALRAGYMTTSASNRTAVLGKSLGSAVSGISEFYGAFMGIGFKFKTVGVDYALLPYGELGSSHRFSLGVKF